MTPPATASILAKGFRRATLYNNVRPNSFVLERILILQGEVAFDHFFVTPGLLHASLVHNGVLLDNIIPIAHLDAEFQVLICQQYGDAVAGLELEAHIMQGGGPSCASSLPMPQYCQAAFV
jgi:hypothetical protein